MPQLPLPPGSTLGILGGGQLGRMLSQAASRLGFDVVILDPEPNSPAGRVSHSQIVAAYDDPDALTALGRAADVVTFEFENVPAASIERLAEAGALVRALDQPGNVGYHELALVNPDDAQIGMQRGERVVGDFRLGGTDHTEKRGLAGIGEANQPNVGEELQLHDFPLLQAVFPWLGIAWRLVGGRLEMVVAEAATSSGSGDDFLTVLGDFSLNFTCLCVFDKGAKGNLNDGVIAVRTMATVARSCLAVLSDDVALVLEVQKRPKLAVPADDHVASTAAISTIRTSLRGGLVAVHVRGPLPPLA